MKIKDMTDDQLQWFETVFAIQDRLGQLRAERDQFVDPIGSEKSLQRMRRINVLRTALREHNESAEDVWQRGDNNG